MDRIKLSWTLHYFFPRLDITIPREKMPSFEAKLWEVFPFKYRNATRFIMHYKLPVYFHIPAIRKHYEKKINEADN